MALSRSSTSTLTRSCTGDSPMGGLYHPVSRPARAAGIGRDSVSMSQACATMRGLEACDRRAGPIEHFEMAAADPVALHLLQRPQEALLLLHAVHARHHGAGHAAEPQLVAVELEAAGHAVAPTAARDARLVAGKDQVRLTLLLGHPDRRVVQAHQLPVGAAQG